MCAMRYEDLQRIEIDGWKYVVFEEQCSVGILDGVVADGQKTLVLPESIEANGEHLLVESVEMGAFYSVDSIGRCLVQSGNLLQQRLHNSYREKSRT